MKKFLALMLTLIVGLTACLGLTACGGAASSVVNVRPNTITVGYTDYEPMNYEEAGVLKGFDTELALMTFNALGYEVRFKLIDWSQKYNELNGNTIQCIWNGFTANSDDNGVPRNQSVNFSYYYMENKQCIVKKSVTPDVATLEDLALSTVAYEIGSAAQDLIKDVQNVNKKGVTSQMDAIKEVNAGTAQYAVVDLLLASRICGKGNFTSLELNDGYSADAEYYAIGFRKNQAGEELRDKVNIMLETFVKTGQFQALAEKYGLEKAISDNFFGQWA